MPYLILVIGLLIGFYALYRFFLNANVNQVKAFIASAITAIFGLALLYLALTGKLIAALIGLVGAAPALIGWFKRHAGPNDVIEVKGEEIDDDDIIDQ